MVQIQLIQVSQTTAITQNQTGSKKKKKLADLLIQKQQPVFYKEQQIPDLQSKYFFLTMKTKLICCFTKTKTGTSYFPCQMT